MRAAQALTSPWSVASGTAKPLLAGVRGGVDQAGGAEQEQQPGGEVGHERGLAGLGAELAEPVGGQQQPAQRLALEHGLPAAALVSVSCFCRSARLAGSSFCGAAIWACSWVCTSPSSA